MKSYTLTFQITGEVMGQVSAASAEAAITTARALVEDCSCNCCDLDYSLVKVEEN